MDIGEVFVIKRCNAVIAWFMLEGDRDFCCEQLTDKDPQAVYSTDKMACVDICGIENPQ